MSRCARGCALLAIFVLGTYGVAAENAPSQPYDVPAGDATATLRVFAEQSGVEIIFPDTLRGVSTNAVQGTFTEREALERLLAGTPLVVNESRSGALAVSRRPAPPRERRMDALSDAGSDADPDDMLVLSPFVVASGEDNGYHASSTLAGSRVKTSLKDVAGQISVFTPQLMSDLGLTNLEEVYLYSTNVEGYLEFTPGGAQGASFGTFDPGKNNRIRGLGLVTVLRGFFETSFDVDTYNMDRVTIASGPNALLFGLGNPGGITDVTLETAHLHRNRAHVDYRHDNFSGYRASFDANMVLRPKKVALRVAALDADNRTFRVPNRDGNRRIFGTLTVQPLPETTVRLNGEWIHRDASRAAMIPAHDYVTPWADAGRAAFDNAGLGTASTGADVSKRIADAGLSLVLVRLGGNFVQPVGNTPSLPLANYANTAATLGPHELQPHLQDRAFEFSLSRPDLYQPRNNIYGTGNVSRARGRIFNGFVEQKITPHLYVEAGFMTETNQPRQGSYVDANNSMDIFADANTYLPDGITPNPNFGKLYSQAAMVGMVGEEHRSELRLTASYDLDLARNRGWSRHLGSHHFAAMLSDSDYSTKSQTYRALMRGTPGFLPTGARTNLRNPARVPVFRTYLGDGVASVSPIYPGSALDFAEPQFLTGPGGERVEIAMFSNPDGSYGPANGTQRNVISQALVDQAHLLQDRLVVTVGWRESRVRLKGSLDAPSTTPMSNGLYPHLRDARFGTGWDTYATGRSLNWGVVARPFPWLSLHYSDSSNFAVQEAPWFSPYGAPIPGSNGVGRDYGFSIHTPNDRVSLRVNAYTNDQNHTRPDNTISALRNVPMALEQRVLELAPGTEKQGMDLSRYGQANYQVTGTQQATGGDIELTFNPTPRWRGVFNAGRQRTTTWLDDTWFRWVEQRLPVWQTLGNGWDSESFSLGGVRTIHEAYDEWVATQRDPVITANGRRVDNQREWRANGIVTHAFRDGPLRGLTVGVGGRWRSANIVGYRLKQLPSGVQAFDLDRPYKGAAEFYVDTFASYSLPRLSLRRTQVSPKLQLNVRNVFDKQGLTPTQVLSNGTPAVYTYKMPRQVILSVMIEL